MKTTDKVINFKKALQTYCEPHGIYVIGHWGSKRTATVMKMASKGNGLRIIRILYVKDRSSDEGFWGLNINQVRAFENQGHQWDVVLLLGSGERSYLGTSQQVKEGSQEGSRKWSRSEPGGNPEAGDYKVHERDIEGWFTHFESYDALFSRLLSPIDAPGG